MIDKPTKKKNFGDACSVTIDVRLWDRKKRLSLLE